MASGDLFRAFTVRFSFKKEQQVRLLKKFEDEKLTGGKAKNQIVMDALEMYFDALENNNDTKEDKWDTKEFVEQYRQECKEELLGGDSPYFDWRQDGRAAVYGVFPRWQTGNRRSYGKWIGRYKWNAGCHGQNNGLEQQLEWRDGMLKQGINGTFRFMCGALIGTVWIGIHILKLVLAVMETALLLTGSVAKIVLLVLA